MRYTQASGYTIVELILVIVLTGILASVIAPAILEAVECVAYDQKRNNLVDNARLTFDRLGEEIWSTHPLGGVREASATRFSFDSMELNASTCGDGTVPNGRQVSFEFGAEPDILGLTLSLTCGAAAEIIPSTLSSLVNNLSFSYYGEDGQPMALPVAAADLAKVRSVRVAGTFENRAHIGTRLAAPFSSINEYRIRSNYSQEDYLP